MSENKELDISKQKYSAKVDKYSRFENFDENTLRVRRNLLIFSVIALFYKLSGATLTGKFSFLGLEFDHIDHEMIDLFLLWIVCYHLIHFMWLAHDHFVAYHHKYLATIMQEKVDKMRFEKKVFENTKIAIWWNLQISIMRKRTEEIRKKLEKVKLEKIEEIEEELKIIEAEYENYNKEIWRTFESIIKKSEERFIKINRWRHVLIETTFPSLIGIFASFVLEIL
ncbi:MAG: hypothetical protein ACO201_02315 [Rickettsiales bacterium]